MVLYQTRPSYFFYTAEYANIEGIISNFVETKSPIRIGSQTAVHNVKISLDPPLSKDCVGRCLAIVIRQSPRQLISTVPEA
ncbi:unnamed protein product, partial [Tuber aestivum]